MEKFHHYSRLIKDLNGVLSNKVIKNNVKTFDETAWSDLVTLSKVIVGDKSDVSASKIENKIYRFMLIGSVIVAMLLPILAQQLVVPSFYNQMIKNTLEDAKKHLTQVSELINSYEGEWDKDNLKEHIFPYADEQGRGSVLWPLRFCLSGKEKSPDPFTLLEVLGKQESLKRINNII